MRNSSFGLIVRSLLSILFISSFANGGAVIRVGAGANPAAIQSAVDLFRADLGGVNNGIGGSFMSGRREINWDGVPDINAEPNPLPFNFFNVNSPRGVVFHSIGNIGGNHQFRVSATAASGTAVRFGNIDASYSSIFQTFSAERLFHARFSNVIEIHFFIPGTNTPATVSGFGAVFCDVDSSNTYIEYYDPSGDKISGSSVNVSNNGLSFIGTSFNAGERVAKVIIRLGLSNLQSGNIDGMGGVDVVAMDDFIYGEPRAIGSHSADFDGDGVTDMSVFRPSNGTWFIFSSGTNTFSFTQFGQAGDIPVDGDFDGDSRSDIAVFRPSNGMWFMLKSSNGQFISTQFGQNGDRPIPGDYDKDGKTDIAVFRPASGQWFYLRSSDGQFVATPWGQNMDIPIPASAQ